MSVPARRAAILATTGVVAAWIFVFASIAGAQKKAPAHQPDVFDELYTKGKKANDAMKTLTANFIETTASTLLTKPLVARGRVGVERPSRIVLRYSEPDVRTVLIDGNKMTMSWPSRSITQVTDIGTAQGRVQKYFINGTSADLLREFTVTSRVATDRPGTYELLMVPKRKQIREGLAGLDLWIDQSSMLLTAMRMSFSNGESKLMTFDEIKINSPVDPGLFSTGR